MTHHLRFLAGANAYQRLRTDGFEPSRIHAILGASGGPKWFVLSQLDRVIASELLPRLNGPVHLVGSSIGAWRMACYARLDPAQAIAQLEQAYLEQTYEPGAGSAQIAEVAGQWLEQVFGNEGAQEVLSSPQFRVHIIAARAKGLSARDGRLPLALGLAAAATSNGLNRRWLGRHFERTLFSDPRLAAPFAGIRDGIPTVTHALTATNFVPAILASSAIPLLMPGVRDIPGAANGTYRDGGIVDYHLDLPTSSAAGISLYPHFTERLIPGWFDKRLRKRQVSAAHSSNSIVVCPSAAFIADLPGGKIPDRTDFERYSDTERLVAWRQTIDRCRLLADELADVLAKDQLPGRLEPLAAAA